jgi:predicted dehydrogenase
MIDVKWRPEFPCKKDFGIAHIGCGGIVHQGHEPAYRNFDLHVVGAFDVRRANAEKLAAAFNIPKVYDTVDDLLSDPAVDVVDIAVPPWEQLGIVEKVAAAGKHMLCQKPLSDNFGEAVKIVEVAQRHGVKQAVNQQMRWTAGIAASHDLITRGYIGQPTDAQIEVSCHTDWGMWAWLAAQPGLEVLYHSIHYLDTLRFLFGNPDWITSRHARYAQQGDVKGESKTVTIWDYEAAGLQAVVNVNHYNVHGTTSATFRFLGTEGALEGRLGLMYSYPHGEPDSLVLRRKGQADEVFTFDQKWIPDAFVGPMAGLMCAIENDATPATDGIDNLDTLRAVHASYLSHAERRSVRLSDIKG